MVLRCSSETPEVLLETDVARLLAERPQTGQPGTEVMS